LPAAGSKALVGVRFLPAPSGRGGGGGAPFLLGGPRFPMSNLRFAMATMANNEIA
jgi:hypothetical protein